MSFGDGTLDPFNVKDQRIQRTVELTKIALFLREPKLSEFLHWIGNRLENVYKESPNLDFVRACHERAAQIEEIEKILP